MRFSLRELLLATTLASLAVPALWFANATVYGVAVALTAAIVVGNLIRVVVGCEAQRAAAIGFLIPAVGLVALLALGVTTKLGPYLNEAPTKTIADAAMAAVQQRRSYWQDDQGNRFTTAEAGKTPGAAVQMVYVSRPSGLHFRLIANCLWTLLFGYAGMKYAQHLHARRRAADSTAITKTIATDGAAITKAIAADGIGAAPGTSSQTSSESA